MIKKSKRISIHFNIQMEAGKERKIKRRKRGFLYQFVCYDSMNIIFYRILSIQDYAEIVVNDLIKMCRII